MAGTVRPSLAGGGACTGGHQLAQLFLGPLPLLRKSSTSTPICRGKPRVSNLHFHQQESTKAVLWQPKPGFQLALLSLSQSSTLLLFLFGTPHHGPVQALFHCSNKCRLRELNGDLQTIASCSIGPGWTERERGAPQNWAEMDRCKKDVQRVSWNVQCNSVAASCDREELGCVLCGKPWQWEPQGGKDARCGGLPAAASLGRVGGRAGPSCHHPRPRTRTPGAGPGC